MRLFKDASYRFLSLRRQAYVFSAVVILAGLASIVARGGLNAGVEFTGGTLVQVSFAEETRVGELRGVLDAAGFSGAEIQRFGGTSEFIFRLPAFEGEGGEGAGAREQFEAALSDAFGADGYVVERAEGLSPKVGSELQVKATWAILLSFLLTLIYLAFRFEWRFGVAAVVATVHDILITFGFISLADIEITLATVAAILTIVGYSLNDTIVVFDRVRENLKKKRREPYQETLDRSINETLPRTVLTSSTTLVALLALAILGGPVIRPFAVVLILGILVGTYSSIFVASPVLLEIHHYAKRKAREAPAAG